MSPWSFMILYVYNRIVGVIQVLVDASCKFFLYSRIIFVHLHWFICFHSPSCHDLISSMIFTKSDFYSARLGSKRGDASEHEASRRAAWPKKIETSIRSFPKSWGCTLNHPFFPDVPIFYYQFHFRILQNMNQAFWGTPIYGNYIQAHTYRTTIYTPNISKYMGSGQDTHHYIYNIYNIDDNIWLISQICVDWIISCSYIS